jgi:hypothetical protein
MKTKVGISLVLLMAMFALVPSFFAEGGFFAVPGYEQDLTGEFVWIEDVYFDNVYFLIGKFLVAYLGIVLPFILPKIGKWWSRISTMIGMWFFAAFLFEVFNLAIPDVVLNSNENRTLFFEFLIAFIFGVTTIIIRETWNKAKRL